MKCNCQLSPWWFTKVSIALLLVAQAVLFVSQGWFTEHVFAVPLVVAQAVVITGALFVAGHYFLLKSSTRNISEPEKLVTSGGTYGLIRHPMYLGDFIVIIGLALVCPTWFSVAAMALALIALERLARHEDRLMAERFGPEFDEYRNRSRLIVPFVL